jgi:hypothetical protein
MRKLISALAVMSLLALPVAADAKHHPAPAGTGKARAACKSERNADKAAFKAKYGNKKGKHAFRRCVKAHLKQARQGCRAERKADATAFRTKYGNKKGKHAYRRCVRQHAGDPVA